jgi:hypothetical protein
MLHACFTPFASCFVYTLWCFYAISGTNQLTRCHSASSLFSAILCFRKATQEIFSELDKPKTETPIFPGWRTWTEREPKRGQRAASPWGGSPPLLAAPRGGEAPLVALWRCLSAYLKPPEVQTLNHSAFFPEQFHSAAAIEDKFRGTEVFVPAPFRDGEVPPEPSPSVSIAVSTVSIDLTAISIVVAVSDTSQTYL